MMYITHLLVLVTFSIQLMLTFICSTAHITKQGAPESLTITKKDDNAKVEIALGGILTLKLEAIPGTGYAWQVVQNNPELLKSQGKSIFEPIDEDAKKELLGAPEYQVFRFKAQSSGTNILELHYIREWEKNVEPLKKFSVTVLISQDS